MEEFMATFTGTGGNNSLPLTGLDNSGDDLLLGLGGNDTLEGGLGADTLDGGAGIDWVTYRNASTWVNVTLNPGHGWNGEAQGDILIGIENIQGSAYGDNLQGDNNNNVIEGGASGDILSGWGGIDTLSYANAASSIAVDLVAQTGSLGEAAGDFVYDFENVIGSRFADTIVGTAGDNVIQGRGGADYLNAGAGIDWASYETTSVASGVTVSLLTGAGTQGDANGDTLIGFENLRGSTRADTLTGDTGNNVIAGGAGADTLDGGAGGDWASYQFSTGALTVSLATGLGTQGDANGDVLSNFENLRGGAGADRLTGDANGNTLEGKGGRDTLDGGAGVDFAGYDTAAAGVVANLATSAGTTGEALNDVYINIEGLRGSTFNDLLIGNAADNFLDGGLGADTHDGGAGEDWVTYRNSTTSIQAVLSLNGGAVGEATGDQYINVENLEGSAFGDNVQGNEGDNVIAGGGGGDIIAGWGGNDTASYEFAASAVAVSLATNSGSVGEAIGDTFIFVENLRGSNFSDVLQGDAAANILQGAAGADTLDGGAGEDWAYYARATAGVAVSLLAGAGTAGEADGDSLVGIENLRGSAYADTLIGDAGANILVGGDGADTLDGGAGADWTSYEFAGSAVSADLSAAGSGGEAAGDVYAGIENLRGSSFADTLTGDALDNVIEGRAGADTLNGGAGLDWASYQTAATGVVANMSTTTGTAGEAQNDVLLNFEGLRGSMFSDRLVGDAFDNWFDGWLGGADTFEGAGGSDWVTYEDADAAVAINVGAGHYTQFAAGDLFIDIENMRGSRFADGLIGDAGSNVIEGGAGADNLDGSTGIDTVSYQSAGSGVSADLGQPSGDGLSHGTGSRGDAAGDYLNNFENLIGSAYDDVLFGNAGDNSLTGGAGPDVFGFRNGTGTDTVTDFTVAGPGKDTLDVSLVSGIASLSDLTLTQVGADTQIGLAGQGTVVLLNTLVADIDATHFVF
jgi:Ca2+-binding RTX toxin-like protein